MHAYILVSQDRQEQEKEVEKLLLPFAIDAIDRVRIIGQNSIGIADIREARRIISLKPFKSEAKALIIEHAEILTIEAQNALLKTLEEPPRNTIIVLEIATNIDALLPTILSRCQVIQLLTTHNLQLTNKELEVSSQQFAVITGEIGERLKLAEEVSKDLQTVAWLATIILATRQLLITKIINDSPNILVSEYLRILRRLERTRALLSTTNVNPRFTLENLFLSLEMTKESL